MHTNTYLHFNGNCAEALAFYEKAASAKTVSMQRFADAPADMPMPPDFKDKVIHARIQFGDTVIMTSDAPPGRYSPPQGFAVSLSTDTADEADRLFRALSAGGSVSMPIGETFFAHRFAMFTDKFGVPWMVICQKRM